MKYIDICVNLFSERLGDPDAVTAKAAEDGIVCIADGCDMKTDMRIGEYLKTHDGVYGTVGIHPHDAKDMREGDDRRLAELMEGCERIVAFGECGLDYDRMYSPKDVQIRCFEMQIALAEKYGKPLLIHERSAWEDTVRIMRDHPEQARRSVVHCFTGDADTVQRYTDLGMYIGVTGWVCDDRRNGDLLGALRYIPEDRLMTETDAPFLKPRKVRGTHCIPNHIVYVVRRIAQELGRDEEEIRALCLANTRRFFGI